MKYSNNQITERESLYHFSPGLTASDDEWEAYFLYSQRGIGNMPSRLKWAKASREFTKQDYEKSLLEGYIPYYTILGFDDLNPVSWYVMEYLSNSMFGGIDKNVIGNLYIKLLCEGIT